MKFHTFINKFFKSVQPFLCIYEFLLAQIWKSFFIYPISAKNSGLCDAKNIRTIIERWEKRVKYCEEWFGDQETSLRLCNLSTYFMNKALTPKCQISIKILRSIWLLFSFFSSLWYTLLTDTYLELQVIEAVMKETEACSIFSTRPF